MHMDRTTRALDGMVLALALANEAEKAKIAEVVLELGKVGVPSDVLEKFLNIPYLPDGMDIFQERAHEQYLIRTAEAAWKEKFDQVLSRVCPNLKVIIRWVPGGQEAYNQHEEGLTSNKEFIHWLVMKLSDQVPQEEKEKLRLLK